MRKNLKKAILDIFEEEKGHFIEVLAEDKKESYGRKYWENDHSAVIAQFYSSLCHGGDYISLEDGINSMQVVFVCYQSSKSGGKEIRLINDKIKYSKMG